jgi:hypothetical protein
MHFFKVLILMSLPSNVKFVKSRLNLDGDRHEIILSASNSVTYSCPASYASAGILDAF